MKATICCMLVLQIHLQFTLVALTNAEDLGIRLRSLPTSSSDAPASDNDATLKSRIAEYSDLNNEASSSELELLRLQLRASEQREAILRMHLLHELNQKIERRAVAIPDMHQLLTPHGDVYRLIRLDDATVEFTVTHSSDLEYCTGVLNWNPETRKLTGMIKGVFRNDAKRILRSSPITIDFASQRFASVKSDYIVLDRYGNEMQRFSKEFTTTAVPEDSSKL
jgi:hypothetical protein